MKDVAIDSKLITDFIEISHRLRTHQLTTGGGGGISLTIPESNKLLIKGWEIATEDVTEESISLIDISGNQQNQVKPCLETPLHLAVIKAREDIGAVIHAHAAYSTAFGNIRSLIDDGMLVNYNMLRNAVFTSYATPGSIELAQLVAKPFEETHVTCVFMEDHGVTVVGKNIYDAYYRLDMFENDAKIFILSHLLKKRSDIIGTP
jgi:L-fuculose-phosphate aldolase